MVGTRTIRLVYEGGDKGMVWCLSKRRQALPTNWVRAAWILWKEGPSIDSSPCELVGPGPIWGPAYYNPWDWIFAHDVFGICLFGICCSATLFFFLLIIFF